MNVRTTDRQGKAREQHDERRDLSRTVDVLATPGDVGGGNNRDRAGEQNSRRGWGARHPQPPADAANGTEHRERPNPREAGGRAVGVSGPLALQTHGRAAQRSNQKTNDVRRAHEKTGIRSTSLRSAHG